MPKFHLFICINFCENQRKICSIWPWLRKSWKWLRSVQEQTESIRIKRKNGTTSRENVINYAWCYPKCIGWSIFVCFRKFQNLWERRKLWYQFQSSQIKKIIMAQTEFLTVHLLQFTKFRAFFDFWHTNLMYYHKTVSTSLRHSSKFQSLA